MAEAARPLWRSLYFWVLTAIALGVLVGWLWLTNVAMLFGAELNAEIEREKELEEGTAERDTLNRPARNG